MSLAEKRKLLARLPTDTTLYGFEYQGVRFGQDTLTIAPGLCAVDERTSVEDTLKTLQTLGLNCARMGAYKPRTSPYTFQGHGAACLPYVFELCGQYGIRVVCMEILHERHLEEIQVALDKAGHPTGVMLQIGTRNSQNFELLKIVGQQQQFPVLYKRGFGITLAESLAAVEYIAASGNTRIIFCLRGVKTHLGEPHANLPDFAYVPTLTRLTKMPVGVDPSHAVGHKAYCPNGLSELTHIAAQGIIAGANFVLADCHPNPENALVDSAQALSLAELAPFVETLQIARQAYLNLPTPKATHKLSERACA